MIDRVRSQKPETQKAVDKLNEGFASQRAAANLNTRIKNSFQTGGLDGVLRDFAQGRPRSEQQRSPQAPDLATKLNLSSESTARGGGNGITKNVVRAVSHVAREGVNTGKRIYSESKKPPDRT